MKCQATRLTILHQNINSHFPKAIDFILLGKYCNFFSNQDVTPFMSYLQQRQEEQHLLGMAIKILESDTIMMLHLWEHIKLKANSN